MRTCHCLQRRVKSSYLMFSLSDLNSYLIASVHVTACLQIYGDEVLGGGGRGSRRTFFFPEAVQLTIIPSEFFLSLDSVWRGFDTDDLTTTKMALGGFCRSIFNLNKWQQIYCKLETLQNLWPVEVMNLKNAGGGCCCTYVVQIANSMTAKHSFPFLRVWTNSSIKIPNKYQPVIRRYAPDCLT